MRRQGWIGLAAAALLLPAAAGAQMIKPGLWSTTSTITDASMPGAPPQLLAMMKRPTTIRHCVTPEEAARGPRAAMEADKSCTVERFAVTGSRFESAMSCKHAGTTMRAQSSGSFTPTSYAGTTHLAMSGGRGMAMTANVTGTLVGPCR